MTKDQKGQVPSERRHLASVQRRQFLRMTGSMTALLPLLGMPVFAAAGTVQRQHPEAALDQGPRTALWYNAPAIEPDVLREGLPIGNGRMGALVGGDPSRDFLYLTDGSMWLGGRNASLDGEGQFGYTTADFGSLVMLARLYLSVEGHDFSGVTDYRRELDLGEGRVRVAYRKAGVTYTREVFASHPDDVIVIHLSQSGGGSYSGSVDLEGAHDETTRHGEFHGVLANGLRYAACVKATSASGAVTSDGPRVSFRDCSELTIVFCGGTDYAPNMATGYRDPVMDPLSRARAKVEAALAASVSILRQSHIADHRSLFDAMGVDLGASTPAQRAMDTWARLRARADPGAMPDPELEASYLQFGRYLTIAGSRDRLPTGLQGLWLSDNAPAWMADYHSDINVQMNYWLPDRAGLPSCFDALARYCLDQVGSWTEITRQHFNDPRNGFRNSSGKLAGWTVAFSTNIYGGNGWWWHPASNAWLCNSLWQHYQYVPDRDYLGRIYPLLKGACEFWEARLLNVGVTDPVTGITHDVLVDDVDWSPEQGPKDTRGITYAQELVWDLFENYRQASGLLGRDAGYAATIGQLQARLYLPRVSEKTGWLEEWMRPDNLGEITHRHLSPLIGFFPGDRIRADSSPLVLLDGVTRLLEARGMTGYGWGCAWRAICWARLRNADKAYQLLLTNLLPSTSHSNGTALNLFDFYKLDEHADAFQIDANFGTPTAMIEMLLYSRPGLIELLPALPRQWAARGRVTGIGARGGFRVDLGWRDGKVSALTVHSVGGTRTTVSYGTQSKTIDLHTGQSVTIVPEPA